MGVKLDYARAKAEADLHRYLESGHQNVPDALRAAVCYLKTLTPGLISEYLKPDLQFPSTAVEDFRSACTDAEEDLWECHFRSVEFHCDCAFSQTDFMTGIYAELSQLQNRAVTDFWSARAEYLAKLGGEPPPSAVSAGADNKPSDGLTRADAQTPDSAAASDSSKFELPGGAAPTSVATPGNIADRNGCERIPGTAALSLADRTEIEQQLQQWRNGISVDISLLLSWSGELAVTTPPESMEYFRELQPNLRSESFLRLSFDWEGSGREILNHDQITATLLNNLQKALRRYGQLAIDLISSKWADKGLHPRTFASRMESAGEALEQDVFQMLGDGVSALAHGASTESLEQALSGNVKTRIAREIELYRRNAQLVGLCELPERNDVAAESGTTTAATAATARASSSSDAIPMESPIRIKFEAGLAAAEVTLDQDLKDDGPSLEIARKYVVNATLTLARCILTPDCAEPYEAIQRAYDFAEWFAGEAIKPAWVWLCVFSEMETSGKLAKYHSDRSAEDGSPEPPSESEMREWHGCLFGVAHEALDEFVAEFWKERLKYFSTAAELSKAASQAASEAGAITTTGHSAGEGQRPAVENTAALGVRSGAPKQEGTKRPGKERKGDASLLAGKRAVNFKIAEQYLGLTERQRQNLVKDKVLVVEGKGQSKKITTDSLRAYVTPENPN